MKLDQTDFSDKVKYYSGHVASQEEVYQQTQRYWGYQVRVASSVRDVFDCCPYEDGYDLKLGTDDNGRFDNQTAIRQHREFKHGLVFFGGLGGL